MHPPVSLPSALIDCVERDPRRDLKHLLGTSSSILLDESQSQCLLTGLKQRVSLIQGPPGTEYMVSLLFFLLIFY